MWQPKPFPRRGSVDSDDVTDKYYDLQAHLKNDQVEEEGLRKLLLEKSGSGKLDDILAIRRELRSIRGQIEMQQGQLKRLEKDTALATINLKLIDRKQYVPPTAPNLGTSIACGSWPKNSVRQIHGFPTADVLGRTSRQSRPSTLKSRRSNPFQEEMRSDPSSFRASEARTGTINRSKTRMPMHDLIAESPEENLP